MELHTRVADKKMMRNRVGSIFCSRKLEASQRGKKMVELFSRGNKESAQRRTVVGAAGGECLPRDPGSESRKEGDWRSSAKILDGTDPPPKKKY